MEVIFFLSATLFIIATISVVVMIREHNKMFEGEDPVPLDDMPGHYEDYEFSENPSIDHYKCIS